MEKHGKKYSYPRLTAKYRGQDWCIECPHYSKFTFSNCTCGGNFKLPIRNGESVQFYSRCYLYDTELRECRLKNVYVGIDLFKKELRRGLNNEK